MSELATIPTTRDEEWRYADAAWLAGAELSQLGWTDIAVAPGEASVAMRTITGGVERLRVHVGKGSSFALFAANTGAPYARLEVEVTLASGAHFEFGAVTLGGGEARQEFVTRVIHAEPDATSSQVVRAVQWGQSVGNFLGRVDVARDAQRTDAAQNFKAILLEKGASANAKPELEIFADDVKCAHGAAIGALDQTAAFYMAARGITPDVARKLLVRAFVADAFAAMEDVQAREAMLEAALSALDEAVV